MWAESAPPPPFPQVRIGLNLLAKDGWDEYQQSPHIPSGLLYIQFLLLLVHSTSNFKIQWHVEIQKTLTLRLYRVTQVVFSFMKPPFFPWENYSVYKKVYSLFNVWFLCCILLEWLPIVIFLCKNVAPFINLRVIPQWSEIENCDRKLYG